MIVDTSALMAIGLAEPGWQPLLRAMTSTRCVIPAPVLTELDLVLAKYAAEIRANTDFIVRRVIEEGNTVAPFEYRHAGLTVSARERFGKGNGQGGMLNFGDLMVYAIAKDLGEPLLCTGRDFASTDLELHPASRLDP